MAARRRKTRVTTPSPLPDLERLHERHRGLTEAICRSYAEAAAVALARHHSSPSVVTVRHGETSTQRIVAWPSPDPKTIAAWANTDDTTRDAAYSMALASVESELEWVALQRADTRTGADYFVGPPESADLEDAYRLEVSGTDRGGEAEVKRRMKVKLQQTRDGTSDVPAIACVVGFEIRSIAIDSADDE